MQRSERDAFLGENQLYENLLVVANYCATRRYTRTASVKIFCGDEENTVVEEKKLYECQFRNLKSRTDFSIKLLNSGLCYENPVSN